MYGESYTKMVTSLGLLRANEKVPLSQHLSAGFLCWTIGTTCVWIFDLVVDQLVLAGVLSWYVHLFSIALYALAIATAMFAFPLLFSYLLMHRLQRFLDAHVKKECGEESLARVSSNQNEAWSANRKEEDKESERGGRGENKGEEGESSRDRGKDGETKTQRGVKGKGGENETEVKQQQKEVKSLGARSRRESRDIATTTTTSSTIAAAATPSASTQQVMQISRKISVIKWVTGISFPLLGIYFFARFFKSLVDALSFEDNRPSFSDSKTITGILDAILATDRKYADDFSMSRSSAVQWFVYATTTAVLLCIALVQVWRAGKRKESSSAKSSEHPTSTSGGFS